MKKSLNTELLRTIVREGKTVGRLGEWTRANMFQVMSVAIGKKVFKYGSLADFIDESQDDLEELAHTIQRLKYDLTLLQKVLKE